MDCMPLLSTLHSAIASADRGLLFLAVLGGSSGLPSIRSTSAVRSADVAAKNEASGFVEVPDGVPPAAGPSTLSDCSSVVPADRLAPRRAKVSTATSQSDRKRTRRKWLPNEWERPPSPDGSKPSASARIQTIVKP
jgi:hypothetical protein